jgi:hypothetical protein
MTAHELAAILAAGPDLEVSLALRCHGCWGPKPEDELRVEVLDPPFPGVVITDEPPEDYLNGQRR